MWGDLERTWEENPVRSTRVVVILWPHKLSGYWSGPSQIARACAVVSHFCDQPPWHWHLPFRIAIVIRSPAIITTPWNTDGDEWSRTVQDMEYTTHMFVRWLYLRDLNYRQWERPKICLEDKVQVFVIRKQQGRSSWYEGLVLLFFHFARLISLRLFQVCLFWPTFRAL